MKKRLGELEVGTRFRSTLGDVWEVSEHATSIVWAKLVRVGQRPTNAEPLPIGSRDRWAPWVIVEVLP